MSMITAMELCPERAEECSKSIRKIQQFYKKKRNTGNQEADVSCYDVDIK